MLHTNDGDIVLRGLELPESDINGDTTLTLGLQLVKHPSILEGALAQLSGFLYILLVLAKMCSEKKTAEVMFAKLKRCARIARQCVIISEGCSGCKAARIPHHNFQNCGLSRTRGSQAPPITQYLQMYHENVKKLTFSNFSIVRLSIPPHL